MAKQTKSSVAPAANAPGATPQAGASASPTAPVIERGANDLFKAVPLMEGDVQKVDANNNPMFVEPAKKLAPQAQTIINTIRAAGNAGLTRAQLNANLKGVLVTRQPESRIVTYYQKTIVASGAVQIVKAPEVVSATPVAQAAAA